jgi:hypothetical protein
MVYLNEASEYAGGETVFYSHDKEAMAPSDAFREAATVRGATGRSLVFQHNLWHEVGCLLFFLCGYDLFCFKAMCLSISQGKPLASGVKYILRTDLMFVRVATGPLTSAQQYLDKEEYKRAEELYQQSIRFVAMFYDLTMSLT